MENIRNHDKSAGEQTPEIITIDGLSYRRVPSGYTIREFYSHSGPGWDFRHKALEECGVKDPKDLPDEPHYDLEPLDNI